MISRQFLRDLPRLPSLIALDVHWSFIDPETIPKFLATQKADIFTPTKFCLSITPLFGDFQWSVEVFQARLATDCELSSYRRFERYDVAQEVLRYEVTKGRVSRCYGTKEGTRIMPTRGGRVWIFV
ncbi:hypothetical protein BT69DRAFT_348813 [Atractiella rhizophila]|nr:hypothetical protein BT69DRAFT_348813 [Atractiella rhizophila]